MHQKGVNVYYRYLGKTGMKVSELCLGASALSRSPSSAHAHVHFSLTCGRIPRASGRRICAGLAFVTDRKGE
jgi:hypothetical protein